MFIFIDRIKREVHYRKDVFYLTKKEMLLFEFIINNRYRSEFKTSDAVDYIWKDRGNIVTANNLHQLAYRLKKTKVNCFFYFRMDFKGGGEVRIKKRVIFIKKDYRLLSKVLFVIVSYYWDVLNKISVNK